MDETDSFVNLAVLQLNETSGDGGDVALLVGEGDPASSLWILELGIGVDAGVTDAAVEAIHDHGEFDRLERSRHATDENGFARIEWL